MNRSLFVPSIGLLAVAMCTAQVPESATAPAKAEAKLFRITFTLSGAQAAQQSRTVSLDVALPNGQSGQSAVTLESAAEHSQQTFKCVDMHRTAKGLAGKLTVEMTRELPETAPGTEEHIVSKLTVERQLDLAFGEPEPLTDASKLKPLGKAGSPGLPGPGTPTQITVTAISI